MSVFQNIRTVGILGGGQLAQMISLAAIRLGHRTCVFCPQKEAPALSATAEHICAAYDDEEALRDFAQRVDVFTYEFENIPLEGVRRVLCSAGIVGSSLKALEIAQHREKEKLFLQSCGLPVVLWESLCREQDVKKVVSGIGYPCVLKSVAMGYDGKSQMVLRSALDISKGEDFVRDQGHCIVEKFIEFKREISVILCCSVSGEEVIYPLAENFHRRHILMSSCAPLPQGDLSSLEYQGVIAQAEAMARKVSKKLEIVGLLAIEFFLDKEGKLYINELAPRPHNSGHWTMNGGCVDQFENLVRALLGYPLGNVKPLHQVTMHNIFGINRGDISEYLQHPYAYLHVYGKLQSQDFRKMGHVNIVSELGNTEFFELLKKRYNDDE